MSSKFSVTLSHINGATVKLQSMGKSLSSCSKNQIAVIKTFASRLQKISHAKLLKSQIVTVISDKDHHVLSLANHTASSVLGNIKQLDIQGKQ